jgi:hypothetical protein
MNKTVVGYLFVTDWNKLFLETPISLFRNSIMAAVKGKKVPGHFLPGTRLHARS